VIIVVSVFLFFAALMAALVGFSLVMPGTALDGLGTLNPSGYAALHSIGRLAGVLLLALGAGCGAAGVGLLRGRRWAWYFALGVFLTNGLGDLVQIGLGRVAQGITGVAISLGFVWILVRGKSLP